MNNTEKLLRAFIEASGYEIESTLSTKGWESETPGGEILKGSFDTIDYKVTKKDKSNKTDKEYLSELREKKFDIEYQIGCL